MFPLGEKVYVWLKWLAAIAFPAGITLTGAVGLAVEWGYTDVTVTVTSAVGTFLGALVAGSTKSYNKLIEEAKADPLAGLGNDVTVVEYDPDKGAATLADEKYDWSEKITDGVGEDAPGGDGE